jgi:site-specific recombinase XerD
MANEPDEPLPPIAYGFLRTRSRAPKAWAIVRRLYRWLREHGLSHGQLRPAHVTRVMDRPFGKPLAHRTSYDYRGELLAYLEWLSAAGELSFEPHELRRGPLSRRPLPELAEQYVEALSTTHRRGTCQVYRTDLRRFCYWLAEQGIGLERLGRRELVRWLVHLEQRGLKAATRAHTIMHVRSYLRWLHEHGWLERDPELLLRSTDIPKRPRYLPRPLSPEADRQLQQRLGQSRCRYQQGLLLMRRTGLRLGELMALEYECVRSDGSGHRYLKVPLGKLNNERLVPLDEQTLELVGRLQADGSSDRPWLLLSPQGHRTYPSLYWRALRQACEDIAIDGAMTSHRLRHSYATTLLSGGMSLVGVMRLLGHRSYQTTLVYAAVTQEAVGREYFEALEQLERRYERRLPGAAVPEPAEMIADVVRWVRQHLGHERGRKRTARRLIKRLDRIAAEIARLTGTRQSD